MLKIKTIFLNILLLYDKKIIKMEINIPNKKASLFVESPKILLLEKEKK